MRYFVLGLGFALLAASCGGQPSEEAEQVEEAEAAQGGFFTCTNAGYLVYVFVNGNIGDVWCTKQFTTCPAGGLYNPCEVFIPQLGCPRWLPDLPDRDC